MNNDNQKDDEEVEQNQIVSVSNSTALRVSSSGSSSPSTTPSATPSSSAFDDATTEESEASLEMLGPIVLNTDGTMSRISNWREMTSAERESAKRLIAKRNKSRKAALSEERQTCQNEEKTA
mmetsp:Transcript_4428/g.8224  ORF Transcript_4428/g.8224 Transcript_4428/m.8224 type:complete len:122 (-) Transcript_4428:2530-2895(-)